VFALAPAYIDVPDVHAAKLEAQNGLRAGIFGE
jgi:hypothetical protein